ncbi:MAG: imidazole glycerol phosphate synthase cyclase subunit [Ferrovibrio sp.]|uniref:imidazole glycerol phosphate synthase subunit HisF n=1 Tax=Ferrovibrio sp. TaxID=1917215 RepID=UPI00262CB810|nr:imidazole glycerol phosphate synthase cyclase subunit [Ferrovibrio sp.]MCW0234939.1 imidazole glycerol phosphate synthase cyclase subunit [Ferrovibrio sp.]
MTALSKRIVTVLTFNNGVLFRTKLFHPDYRYTLNFVDAWSVDEIVVLDVTRQGGTGAKEFHDAIGGFASRCFVPLAAGGGIRTLDDVARFLDSGADKIVINTGALQRPSLITEIAESYGSQCVVLSIDAKQTADGGYEVYADAGSMPTGRRPREWAQEAEQLGAGEILITSIDRDGSLEGYDLNLSSQVAEAVGIPVLALGGCGSWAHMQDLFSNTSVDAACTQNIYHFTETSIRSAKSFLSKRGVAIRTE